MTNELLDILRSANHEFQEFSEQVAQKGAKVVDSRGAERRLEKLNLRLQQVSQLLSPGGKAPIQTPESAYEVLKYRENLKALRSAMETLQFSLLVEKGRLENVRANLQAACAWATSIRDIS